MSKTVHYTGVAQEIKATKEKTIEQIAEVLGKSIGLKMDDYTVKYHNGSWVWLLQNSGNDDYISIEGKLYQVYKTEIDIDKDIMMAKKLSNGDVSFELKYYNGGAGFIEFLTKAFNKL